jgi:predicted dehydrogenase
VACNLRFHPCLLFIKDYLITQEKLKVNEVNVYCGSFLPDWRPGKDYRKVYSANANMGGGVHLDLFHELDYTTWLFGFPNEWNSIKRNVSSLDIDAVDYANYSLEYDEFTANIILNYYRNKVKRTIEIVFENQILLVDLINNTIIDEEENILFKVTNYAINQTYKDQISYFINCLNLNQHPMNSLKESIEVLKIVL